MDIRIAVNPDIEGILELLVQVNQIHADGRPDIFKNGGSKYTSESLRDKLELKNERIYVAVEDGRVLGYAFLVTQETRESTNLQHRRVVYIDDLCIDEKERGKHIGTSLFNAAREYAGQIQADAITLRVWELNSSAKAFYEAVGMKPLYTEMELKM